MNAIILTLGLSALAIGVLAVILYKIGDAMTTCPDTGRVAKIGTITILTVFVCVTFGLALIVSEFPQITTGDGVPAMLGMLAIAFGIGFGIAVSNLQSVVLRAADRIAKAREAAQTAPAPQAQ